MEEGKAVDDPLLAALLANPLRIEEMLQVPGVTATGGWDALTAVTGSRRKSWCKGRGAIAPL